MFKDLFNFGKQRNLRESFGFYVVHTGIIGCVMVVLSLLGVA
jgi:hypothetical protein